MRKNMMNGCNRIIMSWNMFDELFYLIHHILYLGGRLILLSILIGIIVIRIVLR